MACEIRIGDVGTIIEITITDCGNVIDVSSATVKEIVFRSADGTRKVTTADFVTDGTDGKISYTSIADFFDSAGTWKIQANITLPDWSGKSEIQTFIVYDNL